MTSEMPRKFGATYMTMNNPYFQDMNAQIEEIVEANGDILIYRDPAQDQKKQNEQIMDMLEEGITALFLNPVNWETVRPALIACKEADVPVFVIDTLVYDDKYVAFSIVSDNYDAGVQCAKDMMKKKYAAKILILDSPGTKSIEDRVQGFVDTIEERDSYEIVKREHGMGELEVSMDVTQEVLRDGVEFVSCPTCGRTRINLIKLASDVENAVKDIEKDITVAVMGCVVNGPGEAKEADIGIAGGDGCAVIFRNGEIIRKVDESEALDALICEIENYRKE